NGYLDLLLDAGLLSLPLLLYVSFHAFRMAVRYIRFEPRPIAFWPATYFCFFLLNNVFESQLLTTRSLEFLLFAAIITSVAISRQSELPLTNRLRTLRALPELRLARQASDAKA